MPKNEGGLGLKNIFSLNRSLLLKRCWDMASGDSHSSIFLRNRFLKCGLHPKKSYHVFCLAGSKEAVGSDSSEG